MPYNILVVDKSIEKASFVKEMLISAEQKFVHAIDLTEAYTEINRNEFDAVIINPVMLDSQKIQALLKHAKSKNARIVTLALLNYPPKTNELSSILCYADDYIEAFSMPELIAQRIRFLIEKSQAQTALTVLAIGAHPDDVEIGCGGSLVKHKQKGNNIKILTLTSGGVGGDADTRKLEAAKAAALLNAELFWGELQDAKIACDRKTISVIEEVIKQCHPDIIYTHSGSDGHQDHRNTHLATITAARRIKNVYCYQSPTTNISFKPHKFESITSYVEEKLSLIECHKSQTEEKCRPYLTGDMITSTAMYWGRFAGYEMVEPFEIIRSTS